jgi:hypothetical protein
MRRSVATWSHMPWWPYHLGQLVRASPSSLIWWTAQNCQRPPRFCVLAEALELLLHANTAIWSDSSASNAVMNVGGGALMLLVLFSPSHR